MCRSQSKHRLASARDHFNRAAMPLIEPAIDAVTLPVVKIDPSHEFPTIRNRDVSWSRVSSGGSISRLTGLFVSLPFKDFQLMKKQTFGISKAIILVKVILSHVTSTRFILQTPGA